MFKQTNVRVLTRPPTQKNHNAEATAASSRNQNGSAEQQQRPAQSVRKADPGGLSAMVHNLLRRISPACGPRKSQRPRSKTAASTSPSASVTPTPTASRPTSLQREKAGTARKWTKSQLVRGASWHEPDDCAMRNVRVMSCTSSGTRSIMQRLCRSRTLTPYNAHADCAGQLNGPRESASATWTPVMHGKFTGFLHAFACKVHSFCRSSRFELRLRIQQSYCMQFCMHFGNFLTNSTPCCTVIFHAIKHATRMRN